MAKTQLPTDEMALVGVIDPDASPAATYTTAWVNMGEFNRLLAVIMVGQMNASATIDAKIEQATDDTGTGAKDLAGSAITQLSQAGTDDSDKQALIQCFADDLDLQNDLATRACRSRWRVQIAICRPQCLDCRRATRPPHLPHPWPRPSRWPDTRTENMAALPRAGSAIYFIDWVSTWISRN